MLCALTIRSTVAEDPPEPQEYPCGSVPVEGTPVFTGAMGWAKFAFHNPPQNYNPNTWYEVTHTGDYLPGVETPIQHTLRYAIEHLTGPRNIKVLVNDVIILKTGLTISNQSYVKITGEYATGCGPTITASEFKIHDSNNIVLRYMRFRSAVNGPYHCARSLLVWGEDEGCNDIIIDHCSIGASRDDNIAVSGKICRVTVQNCIIGGAVKGASYAGIGSEPTFGFIPNENITFCRNLITNTYGRQLIFASGGRVDFVNNVVAVGATHLELFAKDGINGPKMNIINNLFRTTNVPYWGDRNGLYYEDPIRAKVVEDTSSFGSDELPWSTNEDSIHISGNLFLRRDWKNDLWEEPHTSDQWDFTFDATVEDPDPSGEPNFPTQLKRDTAWTMPSGDTIEDAEEIEDMVLNDANGAGCRLPTSQPALDDYDQDLVDAAPNGVRLYPPANEENNGFPGTPMLVFPLNEATGVSTAVTVTWQASDETDKYNVYVGQTDPPASLAGSTTERSLDISNLSANTQYYWQVWAADSCSQLTGSEVRVFTTSP